MTTLFEARQSLFVYFQNKGQISPSDDHALVELPIEDKNLKISILTAACDTLEKAGIVKSALVQSEGKAKPKTIWILEKPLGMLGQSVSISSETAGIVAKIVNSFCNQVGNTKDYVDVFNIKEDDIQKLLAIVDTLVSTEKK